MIFYVKLIFLTIHALHSAWVLRVTTSKGHRLKILAKIEVRFKGELDKQFPTKVKGIS